MSGSNVEAVCHEEQMTIWTGEIVDSLSMGGYFRERLSYDDGLNIHAVIARDLRSIIGSAFIQAEPPAPCDGSGGAGETAQAGSIRQDDSAVDEASSDVEASSPERLERAVKEWREGFYSVLKERDEARTALAESERKRVEADRLLRLRTRQGTQAQEAWAQAAELALSGNSRALHAKVAAWRDPARLTAAIVQSTPPQETPDVTP